jgi:hypothetical protein
MEMAASEAQVAREDGGPLLAAHGTGDGKPFQAGPAVPAAGLHGYLFHCGVPRARPGRSLPGDLRPVHQRARTYDPSRPLHPWLFTVVANAVRTYFRKQKRRLFFFAGPPPEDVKTRRPMARPPPRRGDDRLARAGDPGASFTARCWSSRPRESFS